MSKTTRLLIAILAVLLFLSVAAGVIHILSIPPEKKQSKELVINEENFPNMWVRREVGLQLDKDSNNCLSEKEIREATSMSLPIGDRNTIIQPNELNLLPNLKQLLIVLNGKKGKTIDLHDLKHVEKIEVRNYAEGQSEVTFSKLAKLSSVTIQAKYKECMVTCELKDCSKIKEMNVENGEGLNGFAVSDAPTLEKISIYYVGTTSLDFHDLPGLKYLELNEIDKVKSLKLSNLQKLKKFYVKGNQIKNLSLLTTPSLNNLVILNTALEKLDLSGCPNIKEISADSNVKIKTLDLSNQRQLKSFIWNYGKLQSIQWGKKDKLTSINVNDNKLSGKWDLLKFPKLKELHFDNNSFEQVLGKGHKKIGFIYCENNKLKLIDLRDSVINRISGSGNHNVIVYLPKKRERAGYFDDHFFEPEKDIGYKATVYYV